MQAPCSSLCPLPEQPNGPKHAAAAPQRFLCQPCLAYLGSVWWCLAPWVPRNVQGYAAQNGRAQNVDIILHQQLPDFQSLLVLVSVKLISFFRSDEIFFFNPKFVGGQIVLGVQICWFKHFGGKFFGGAIMEQSEHHG